MKKAKIDILDIADSLETAPNEEPALAPLEKTAPDIDLHAGSFLAEKQTEDALKRRRFLTWKTMLMFAVPTLCLVLVVVAVVVFLWNGEKKAASVAAKQAQQGMPGMVGSGPIYYDDLAAVVSDPSGKLRLVRFGISAMPARGGVTPNLKGDDREVRIAAARIVSGTPFPELLNDRGREQIKEKIKTHIESVHRPGTVGNVWITSWIVL